LTEATTARPSAALAFRIVMAAGLVACLTANLPGHMSVDSVIALGEARNDVRMTWAPAAFSWTLGLFDSLVSGTGLYVTASASLLFASLASLPRLRPRSSWLAVAAGLAAIATPQLLIYQGIVWRDVLFANLAVAGFVLIAHAARAWDIGPRLPLLAAAAASLALAAAVRQNGLILVIAAAFAIAWIARDRGLRPALAWSLGFVVVTAILAFGVDRLAQPGETAAKLRPNAAALILQHYDVVGAKAHHPQLSFQVIGRADPAAQAILEARAVRAYSPSRVDTLDQDAVVRRTLWHVPDAAMRGQWMDVLRHYPEAYALHRAHVFWWVLATPDLRLCLPVQVGVEGPPGLLADLDVASGVDVQDAALGRYASRFYGTAVYSHLTWAVVALVLIGLLLRRGDPADVAIAALLAAALLFAASFAVISVACDYRYLYLLDLAAIAGGLYAALDPPAIARKRSR
jgi:hypothetical protein